MIGRVSTLIARSSSPIVVTAALLLPLTILQPQIATAGSITVAESIVALAAGSVAGGQNQCLDQGSNPVSCSSAYQTTGASASGAAFASIDAQGLHASAGGASGTVAPGVLPGGGGQGYASVLYDVLIAGPNPGPGFVDVTGTIDGQLFADFLVPGGGALGLLQIDILGTGAECYDELRTPNQGPSLFLNGTGSVVGNVATGTCTTGAPFRFGIPFEIRMVLEASASALAGPVTGGGALTSSALANFVNTAYLSGIQVFDGNNNDITSQLTFDIEPGAQFPNPSATSPIPETGTMVLLATGLIMIFGVKRRGYAQ